MCVDILVEHYASKLITLGLIIAYYVIAYFYNLALFYSCGRLYALHLCNSLCFSFTPLDVSTMIYDATIRRLSVLFYTTIDLSTVRFYASTFLRLTFLLHHCTILRIYDATIRRLSVLFYTTVRFYASMMLLYADCQFCFTPLYDSTHL